MKSPARFPGVSPLLFFLLFTAVFLPFLINGAGYIPVRNFPRDEYGGGTQNWCAVSDSLGRVYFGNNDGMLSFDGLRWRLHRLPNSTAVRSLCYDAPEGRIFAGASGEFGYFASDSITGALRYHSLIPTLAEGDRDFSEIWNIFRLGNKIWFQGDFALYRFDGNSTIAFPMEARISTSACVFDNIYVAFNDGKIVRFNGSRTEPLPASDQLENKKIAAILPYPDNHSLLIATSMHGLYQYDGNSTREISIPYSQLLRENQIFCATCNGSRYAFGTVNNGAVTFDFASGESRTINRHNGTHNNTILGLKFDRMDNLWMMLDNGIDYAVCSSPVTSLLSHLDEIGAGYASIRFADRIYLGTNQALYSRTSGLSDEAPLKKEINGQIWSLDTIGSTLFALCDAGVFYLNGDSFRKIANIEGGYKISPLKGHPDLALASTYSRFHLLRKSGNDWIDDGPVKGYDDIGGDFFQAPDGAIWKSHWMKGVFRLTLTPDARAFSRIELFDTRSGLPSNNNNSASIIDGEVYISSEDGVFRYDSISGLLVADTRLTETFSHGRSGHLYSLPDGSIMKINPREFTLAYTNSSGDWERDTSTYLSMADQLIPGFEHISYISPRELIVSSQDGFKSVDLHPNSMRKIPVPSFVSAIYSGDSLLYTPPISPRPLPQLRIPAALNSIRIEFTATEYATRKGVEFSTRLDNYDKEWSPFSTDASRDYTRLFEGIYTFRIRTRHLSTGNITETSFTFRVLPPWYRSVWACIFYFLLLIGAAIATVCLIRRWKKNAEEEARRRKENELSEILRARERETLLKDHEIAVLKSQQLEHDIRHKSSELGNKTMNLIRKNEILTEISSKIAKLQDDKDLRHSNPELHKALTSIRRSINENISHDDDWKSFTENFDIVYQDYTRRLRELHPELTSSDIRICCYIRMGLASKEIAPLINISFRSVEMTRYRLRKKMNLDKDITLADYLRNIR